jgi:hypothetical protein
MSRVAHISGFGLSVGGSWRARFELGCKPQTADNAAALPLVVAKRFEFACELWHRQRLVVVQRTRSRKPRAARPRQGKEPLDISRRSRTKAGTWEKQIATLTEEFSRREYGVQPGFAHFSDLTIM